MKSIQAKSFAAAIALIGSHKALAAGKTAAELQSDLESISQKASQSQNKLKDTIKKATKALPPGSGITTGGTTRTSVDVPVPPEGATTADIERAPAVISAPPKTIRAWIGEELVLEGSAAGPQKGPEKTYFAWILNGTVVCQLQNCRIPLDGRTLQPGAHQLLFVAYNVQGSSISRHIIHVQKSSWTIGMPVRAKEVAAESVDPRSVKLQPVVNTNLSMSMMQGNAVHAYPENVIVVGNVARNIPWEGQVKTAPRGVARITDPKIGKWFILGNGQVNFVSDAQTPNVHSVQVEKGTVRAQSTEKTDVNKKVENNNSFVSTKEMRLFLDPGVDVAISRIPPSTESQKRRKQAKSISEIATADQFQTRIVVVSGTVRFQLPTPAGATPQTATVPPGVELVIFENGKVGPFERPKPEFMEKLLRQTMTPEEIAERAKRKAEAIKNPVNIAEVLKRVEEYASRSDYFEMLNELSAIEDRKAEDVRISYNLGLAYQGLYQPLEAEKHFRYAMNQDEDFGDAPWQLGLMMLDEKKWEEAADAFSEARSRLPASDKRQSEYYYYSGVAKFNVPSDFAARNRFTRALLWEDTMEQSLKASSGDFLKKLRERKDWSVIIPIGAQWDGNALATDSTATSKSLIRSISGLLFSWDPSATRDAPGWYNTFTASAMYAKHFPNTYKNFDSIILGTGASQIRKTSVEVPPPADKPNEKPTTETRVLKFYENVGGSIVDNNFSLLTITGGVNAANLDASLSYEADTTGTGNSSIIGKEQYNFKLWSGASGLASDLDLASEQRLALTTSTSYGHSVSATVTPSLSVPINSITNAKLASALGIKKTFYGAETLSINAAPSAALTRFITPWLVGMASVGYEVIFDQDSVPAGTKLRTTYKPSAGITLSGLL